MGSCYSLMEKRGFCGDVLVTSPPPPTYLGQKTLHTFAITLTLHITNQSPPLIPFTWWCHTLDSLLFIANEPLKQIVRGLSRRRVFLSTYPQSPPISKCSLDLMLNTDDSALACLIVIVLTAYSN